jgi:hypothetical protein
MGKCQQYLTKIGNLVMVDDWQNMVRKADMRTLCYFTSDDKSEAVMHRENQKLYVVLLADESREESFIPAVPVYI